MFYIGVVVWLVVWVFVWLLCLLSGPMSLQFVVWYCCCDLCGFVYCDIVVAVCLVASCY